MITAENFKTHGQKRALNVTACLGQFGWGEYVGILTVILAVNWAPKINWQPWVQIGLPLMSSFLLDYSSEYLNE